MDFVHLAHTCAPAADPELLAAIVRVESGFNPFAIGIVGDALVRQPTQLAEAVATTRALSRGGLNFSIGLAQVNKAHFGRLGWGADGRDGFEPCANLQAAAQIFEKCHSSALQKGYPATQSLTDTTTHPTTDPTPYTPTYTSTHAALSCYYSGDHLRGARLGYVARVLGRRSVPPTRSSEMGRPRAPASMMLDTHEQE